MHTPGPVPAMLAGRCTTGDERGHGTRVHLVPGDRTPFNGVHGWKALCGAHPGRRSAGWSAWPGMAADCPRCLRAAIAKAQG
jgi:hypothetical protein